LEAEPINGGSIFQLRRPSVSRCLSSFVLTREDPDPLPPAGGEAAGGHTNRQSQINQTDMGGMQKKGG
jgi:hypothetical protein